MWAEADEMAARARTILDNMFAGVVLSGFEKELVEDTVKLEKRLIAEMLTIRWVRTSSNIDLR